MYSFEMKSGVVRVFLEVLICFARFFLYIFRHFFVTFPETISGRGVIGP